MSFLEDSGDTSAKFYNLMKSADEGDEFAKETLKYVFHEVGRETLKEISEVSGYASVVCLAIGQPEGAAFFSGISMATDGLLIIDDYIQGNHAEAKQETIILIAGVISNETLKAGVKCFSKSIQITIGSTGRYYEIGQNAVKSEKILRKLLAKDIADGYFGQQVIPNSKAIIEQAVKIYRKLEGKDNE